MSFAKAQNDQPYRANPPRKLNTPSGQTMKINPMNNTFTALCERLNPGDNVKGG
jgi:hypothetical protein